jgi:hypothetical protein
MTLRITLHDDEGGTPLSPAPDAVRQPQPAFHRDSALLAADDDSGPSMLLYLPDEPEIGQRFRYAEVEWEIVDYRDGWIARLVV